jgi:dTMP kinase
LFLSLEGIDGAGKTATATALVEILRADGVPVTFARHNAVAAADKYVASYAADMHRLQQDYGDGPYFRLGMPHWVLNRASYYALVDHCVVTPALAAGDLVIADGWYYKFVARMVASSPSMHSGPTDVEQVLAVFAPVRVPDCVFLLDVPAQVAARRKQSFKPGELGPQHFGAKDQGQAFTRFQSSVRDHLLAMSRSQQWNVLDGREVTVSSMAGAIRSRLDPARAS